MATYPNEQFDATDPDGNGVEKLPITQEVVNAHRNAMHSWEEITTTEKTILPGGKYIYRHGTQPGNFLIPEGVFLLGEEFEICVPLTSSDAYLATVEDQSILFDNLSASDLLLSAGSALRIVCTVEGIEFCVISYSGVITAP